MHIHICVQAAKPFSFCTHSWIYDPASKSRILQLENQMQQLEAFEQSMIGVSEPDRLTGTGA